jgi:hypothetical protein
LIQHLAKPTTKAVKWGDNLQGLLRKKAEDHFEQTCFSTPSIYSYLMYPELEAKTRSGQQVSKDMKSDDKDS